MLNVLLTTTLPAVLVTGLMLGSGSAVGQTPLPYERDFPSIGYATTAPEDAVARLQERLQNGDLALEFNQQRGYLDAVLRALQLDRSSQLLVFSKTSLQKGLISLATPRAIYFNAGGLLKTFSITINTMTSGTSCLKYNITFHYISGKFYCIHKKESRI